MRRVLLLTVLALAIPWVASADSYGHGRVLSVEGTVSIQRGTETSTEEASPNMPYLPGDRVWTDGGGRAEFQFAGGAILRLDAGSKLDYVAHDEGRDEQLVLRLWSGALYIHSRDRRDPRIEIETPGGVVSSSGRADVRLDVHSGEMRVSVYEGEATLDGQRPVAVRAGERVHTRRGEVVEGPRGFDRAESDEFADWDNARQERVRYAANRPSHIPEDVAPYSQELEDHGSWYYQTEVGHVWRPYVSAGWQPYHDGRWMWTVYGWTWVPAERWGWAPSHFGRWGWGPALGWYWIPGRTWGPAWVSWSVAGDCVGWVPLGHRDRPVVVWERAQRQRGHAGPRGSLAAGGPETAKSPWVYLRRGDLTIGDVGRRRVHPDAGVLQRARVVDATQGRLTKDLVVTDVPIGATVRPRHVSTRPTPGDTVPELRSDPQTTIPVPTARRRGTGDPEAGIRALPESSDAANPAARRWSPPADGGTAAPRTLPPTEVGSMPEMRSAPRRLPPVPEAPVDDASGARARHRRPFDGTDVAPPADRGARSRRSEPERRPEAAPRSGTSDEAEREVLRPVFRPLSRPRDDGERSGDSRGDRGVRTPRGDDGGGRLRGGAEARPRDGGTEARPPSGGALRADPPRQAAPPPPPPAEGAAARRPHRDRDQ